MTFVLKAFGWRGAPIVAVATFISILLLFFDSFESVKRIFEAVEAVDGMQESVGYVLKILGIGYVSGICADVCTELGEQRIASAVLTVARIESLIVVSPMILEIMNVGLELIGQ